MSANQSFLNARKQPHSTWTSTDEHKSDKIQQTTTIINLNWVSQCEMANNSMPNGRGYVECKSPTAALARQSSVRKSSAGEMTGASALPSLGTAGRLVDYDALIKHFDCPVCHDWVTPPIVQCRKGHIVCGPCKSKGLKACPICKQRFSDVNNWMMEQVSHKVYFLQYIY